MHLKTIRHQGNSIKKLLSYMIGGMKDQQKDTMIAYNLTSFDVGRMTKSFLVNDTYRRFPARVKWYHEVLSFSPLDKAHINSVLLEDIARKYISLRNPQALCFSVAHTAEAHVHLHFCFSGTEFRSKKTLRMDDETFANLRYDIERYQIKEYPELENSIVYTNKKRKRNTVQKRDKNTRNEKEFQAKQRLGDKQTNKEQLQQLVTDAFNQAVSPDEFFKTLENAGLEIYERNGKKCGVVAKRKYRFRTLGITDELLMSLDVQKQRQSEMDALTSSSQSAQRER